MIEERNYTYTTTVSVIVFFSLSLQHPLGLVFEIIPNLSNSYIGTFTTNEINWKYDYVSAGNHNNLLSICFILNPSRK